MVLLAIIAKYSSH